MSQYSVVFTLAVTDRTGASQVTLAYAKELIQSGYTVIIFATANAYKELSILPDLEKIGSRLVLSKNTVSHSTIAKCLWMAFQINKIRPDVVVSMNQMDVKITGIAALVCQVPFIAFTQNIRSFRGFGFIVWIKERLYGFILRHCTKRVIGVSDRVTDESIHRFGVYQEKARTVTNGINLRRFHPLDPTRRKEIRKNLGFGFDERIYICVGRLCPQKGQLLLVRSFINTEGVRKKARLVLVGDTSGTTQAEIKESNQYRKEIEKTIGLSNAGNDCLLLGWREDIPDLIGASDVYVHPAAWEGFGLTVAEAMAMARPIIVSDCVPLTPLLRAVKGGLSVATNDGNSLSIALKDMAKRKPEELAEMGHRNRKAALAEFDETKQARLFVGYVREVIERRETK